MGLLYSSKKDKELTIRGREADGPTSAGVAQLKEVYFKGDALSKQGSQGEAIETFESALPVISQTAPQLASSSDLRKWTELLLTSYCLCSSKTVRSSNSSTLGTDSLAAFRAWADFWERQPGNQNVAVGGKLEDAEVSRRHVWKEYYATISYILQNDLTCPTTHTTTAYNDHALRLVQKSELERVEHRYEQLLLAEVHFPKAESHSQEVEEWVDMAIRNWKVLAGSSWDEQALGAGGRAVLGPNILEILYRAATKTYHSTHILRQLFTVHLALAHFDLALKAFDTYFDIVKKAKLRVEKTGIEEAGLDTDDELLETASRCITALCRFGGLEAAEKAKDLAHYLECWLEGHDPCGTGSPAVDGGVNGAQKMIAKDDYGEAHTISPQVLVQTWRSIGIARAQFARLTHDPKARGQYQLKAIHNLTKALSAAFMQSDDIDALYALALILAERRQIDEAILVVGQALAPKHESASAAYADSYSGRYARERSLIPLWHLLALLFSANEEFTEASQACEGAFKQFGRMDVLFGDADAPYQSEHLNRLQEKPVKKVVLDDMDDFERETVLEVKMTQLILTEVQDGPEEAINGTEELLSLYTRLFGNPSTPAVSPPKSSEHPPTTSNGTLRSVKGSIFGRRRRRDASGATLVSTSEKPATPPSAVNPKIQVTGENGTSPTKYRHGHHSHKSEHLLRKKSQSSMKHRNVSAPVPPDQNQQQTQQITPVSNTHDDLLNEVGYQIPQTSLSARLCTPVTRFSAEQGKRHKVGILARVWLLIAGFYRRAEQWEDAKAAIDAAYELVEGMEGEIIRDTSGKIHTDERGWGVGKCVEELWGDIWAERGYLSVSQSAPLPALKQFEASLTHHPDHPGAIVGLSNILLDIYSETLLPPPSLPELVMPDTPTTSSTSAPKQNLDTSRLGADLPLEPLIPAYPLGLPSQVTGLRLRDLHSKSKLEAKKSLTPLGPAQVALTTLPDRLAARDRAHGLLDMLTKLGTGWNCAEAWSVLARAYEYSRQEEKAIKALWWCVELDENRGVRGWDVVRGNGGYIL